MTISLQLPDRILFGRGALDEAADLLADLGTRFLLVHAPSADAERVAAPLRNAGRTVETISTRGEPALSDLLKFLEHGRTVAPDAVIALGGGSVLDTGKALAALLPASGDPVRHLEVVGDGLPLDRPPLPFAAIPTTAGTGSEATRNAVIGLPEAGRKVSLRDARMMARLAIVDPALTESVPPALRLASGLDAVVQVIEPYLSNRANSFTDALCRDAIPRGLHALRAVMGAPDATAWHEMAFVSLTGGIALNNAGLGAVHGLAGVIGGRTGAAHGAICGRLLVPVLRMNLPRMDGPRPDEIRAWIDAAYGGLDAFEAWIDSQDLPKLDAMGVTSADRPAIADASVSSSSMRGNPVALTTDELQEIMAHAAA
ncbi:NAD-dependent methanol dehydrogenase [Jannaschia seosinensis]|uniref:NAD-dependent methanol dehydrogenase n=1 Tax=Jannaschia seosinensis TaxID=313367 RepID=A0A0M7BAV0_9RHOB|nr:iron-containing alcohol dehydrogenase [Jannaschia seosinensis]CUH38942.1 NAD-dependent methanol dehydrogenase [Jannaschia seosinensis]